LKPSDSAIIDYAQLDPDVRLMLEVRDDNAAAFEELVSRYQARLISVFENTVGRQGQAEDLAQEVFLRIYRARKRYQPGARFSTWLYRIAHNVGSNARRSLARRHEVNIVAQSTGQMSVQPLSQMAKEASALMPARQLDQVERAEIVRAAMESLNQRQRMALMLSKFEGMSYEEIAISMELSVSAIKSLLSRARVNLREILVPYMHDGMLPESVHDVLQGPTADAAELDVHQDKDAAEMEGGMQ
jgi:RNA polymerase sigma-70 factor (ECF subfamily)|tara:strand:- start:2290 stop:3021 length:732 start_codon:yes stop_codon:yes gene_type:complete